MQILVAPQKVGVGLEHNLRSLKEYGARVTVLTEMDMGPTSAIPLVRKIFGRGYRVCSVDRGQHSQEIPVIVKTGLLGRVLDVRLVALSPDMPGGGVGNDRWMMVVKFRYGRRVYVIIHTHTDAVVQDLHNGKFKDNARWRVTKKAFDKIEAEAEKHLASKGVHGVFITGDLNVLPIGEGMTDPHSPHQMFRRLGMKYVNTRVVYLAYHGLAMVGQAHIIPAHSPRNSADHAWILARFHRQKAKK